MKSIRQYIYRTRRGKRQKVGLMFGCTMRNKIVIGYSLCCAEDKFDKDKGLAIAVGRAISPRKQDCPPSIAKDLSEFADRCVRYFKDARVFTEDEEFNGQ